MNLRRDEEQHDKVHRNEEQHEEKQHDEKRHAENAIILLDRISTVCAGILFVSVVFLVSAAVLMRYLFSFSFMWSTELSQFLMVWMVLIGAAAAQRRGEHLRIDFIVPHFPIRMQKILIIVQKFAVSAVSLFMVIWGIQHAWGAWKLTTLGLKLPKAIVLLAVPVGMGLFLCLYLLQLLPAARNRKRLNSVSDFETPNNASHTIEKQTQEDSR